MDGGGFMTTLFPLLPASGGQNSPPRLHPAPPARPRCVPAREVEAADPPWVGHGAPFALGNDRQPDHVGDALHFRGSARQGDGRLPAHTAVGERDRHELASGKPGKEITPVGDHAYRGPDRERRTRPLVQPAPLAVPRVEREQPTVGAADDHQIPRHDGRRKDLARYARAPSRLSRTPIERDDLAVERSDRYEGAVGAYSAGK